MRKRLTTWVIVSLLTLTTLACSAIPKVRYDFPNVPPPSKMESATLDKNDKTGEVGLWLSKKDAKTNLKEKAKLRGIIKELKAFWEKVHGPN